MSFLGHDEIKAPTGWENVTLVKALSCQALCYYLDIKDAWRPVQTIDLDPEHPEVECYILVFEDDSCILVTNVETTVYWDKVDCEEWCIWYHGRPAE